MSHGNSTRGKSHFLGKWFIVLHRENFINKSESSFTNCYLQSVIQNSQLKLIMAFNYLSKEGYEKLVAELDELKTTERQKVAAAIAEARDKGDLSENAEYDAAKDAQGLLELKINEMETVLANARILDASQLDTSKVTVFCNVKIKNVKNKKEITYKLVSETEADLKAKKISVNSPVGKGLLGKKIGEIATVETPRGNIEFEVLDIFI